jgi:ADP-ribose pyrophosphatase YjhB (NUDIX family)
VPIADGVRHPGLERALTRATPAGTTEPVWGNGRLPLRVTAYLGEADLPSELITSVRCIVRVGDLLVACETLDGTWHLWPGGRRELGESFAKTAFREVHEETGWWIDVATAQPLGWLHLEHLAPPPPQYPYPHSDFLQLVLVARSSDRDGGAGTEWTDTEGYELRSRLVSMTAARQLALTSDMPVAPFLHVIEPSADGTGPR